MSEGTPPAVPELALDAVTRAAADLAAQPDLAGAISRFLDLVRTWAAPSAVVAVVRDPDAESGWRLLPALCAGSVPVGVDRSVARLVVEAPDCLVRPAVVRGEEIEGVRVRDNVTVPWWCEGTGGLLLLRGVPRPFPENLGAALSLAALPIWPRLLGSPVTRLEALVKELRSASLRLEAETGRFAERLETQGRTVAMEPAPADGRLEALEREAANAVEAGRRLEESLAEAKRRAEELERTLSAAETEREARASAARDLAARVDLLDAERQAAIEVRARAEEALTATRARAQELERELSAAVAGREGDGARTRELGSRVESLEAERDAATESRRRADESLATAKEQLEERRRAAEAAEARATRAEEELRTAQRELALARARSARAEGGDLQARLEEARAAAGAAEARAGDLQARWEKATATVTAALTALRRAAFVPPPLRVSVEEAAGLMEAGGRPARRSGVALLDRDVVGVERLAAELEGAGIEVRIANQPEELALLLRTAEAGAIAAVVCDVMSFRPEQNVAGLIRSWDKDRPGLAFYLSYDNQSPAEAERARRIPMSLTAGHLPRPLVAARLAEAVDNLVRRQGKG